MKPNINFNECLKDSPIFRQSLEESENDLDALETKLEKLVKLCNGMIDAGKVFNNANSLFIGGVRDVAAHFKEDDLVSAALARFTHVLSELQKYHNILLDQAHRSISKNLNAFIKSDIRKVKETRKHFEKISDDMDAALLKNGQAPKSKPHEIEESESLLKAMKSCFDHTSLDYVFQINVLHSKKRFDILDTILSYMHAQNAFFHQGYDLFEDLEPFTKQVASQIEELSAKAAAEKKEMEERHSLVQIQDCKGETRLELIDYNNTAVVTKEGYLFKRTSNAFKTWVRRWFSIKDNQLVYRKRSKDNLAVMEEDLRICTVKPCYEIDRRFCFEVLSPTRTHMLQADSEIECQAWMAAIQAAVSKAYSNRHSSLDNTLSEETRPRKEETSSSAMSPSSEESSSAAASDNNRKPPKTKKNWQPKSMSRMDKILSIPGNKKCCDCGSPEPRWASINLGITLCIECSGIHRSLGVHISKVRSVTLDAWEPELLKVMAELGNDVVNRIYEANVDETVTLRATPQCPRDVREQYIKSKYVAKAFVRKLPKPEDTLTDGNASPIRRWSVCKKMRRSPCKTDTPEAIAEEESVVKDTDVPGDATIKQGESQDSGLGGSATDVIVFGANVNNEQEASHRTLDLEDSDTGSEADTDLDTRSTTSYEDFTTLHPDMLMYKAAQARNIPVMLEALAQGADSNWTNVPEDGKTPLIKAVESSSMAAVEFLLLNRAKVDVKDNRGRTPLIHATSLGHTGQVCQFLKRNANQHGVDENGLDALTIAVNNANADIVTLLRLARLNEEMRETEGIYGGQGDETFNEVFRDFTHMANNAPEKLNRNK